MNQNEAPELPARITVPDDVLWQEVEDRVVLLDLRSNEYHSLNDSGSRMWMLLVESADVSGAVEQLCTTFDADQSVISRDLAAFIGQLAETGLLEAEPR